MAAVGGRVGGVHPGADHRGLVTHQVDAGQQRRQRLAVADVDPVATVGQQRIWSMRGGQQRVDADHFVTRRPQRRVDPGPDETGRAGEQHPHGSSNGNVTPVCARQCVHS